jgi:heavy metal sensor kinase
VSLRLRLGLCLVGVVIVVTLVLCAATYDDFQRQHVRNLDRMLLSQADAVTASLDVDHSVEQGRKEIEAFFAVLTHTEPAVYRIWFEGDPNDFLASHDPANWPLAWSSDNLARPPVGRHLAGDTTMEGSPYRFIWTRRSNPRYRQPNDRHINILISEPTYARNQLRESMRDILPHVAGIVIASILAISWILRWGLYPLRELTARIRTLSHEDVGGLSVDTAKAPAELRAFVVAWNEMVDRLTLAMRQQRRFTADASHELRTPLATIKSTLQTAISQRRNPQEYIDAMERCLEDIDRFEHLITQLLALARLDDIHEAAERDTVDLKSLVIEICERHRPFAELNGATIQCRPEDVTVQGNAQQLDCMLSNLVDNAIKHGPGHSEIRVTMSRNGDHAGVTIHDAGGSIPAAEQAHIFERFYRVDKARERCSGGAGLGLALAQEIARKHGGRITVYSAPEHGTDFLVTLPRRKN